MSAQPMERALQKEVRELREALVAAEAVVEAARTIYPVARPLLWDSDGIPHFEEGEALCEPILRLDEALAVFDGLARSGTDT